MPSSIARASTFDLRSPRSPRQEAHALFHPLSTCLLALFLIRELIADGLILGGQLGAVLRERFHRGVTTNELHRGLRELIAATAHRLRLARRTWLLRRLLQPEEDSVERRHKVLSSATFQTKDTNFQN